MDFSNVNSTWDKDIDKLKAAFNRMYPIIPKPEIKKELISENTDFIYEIFGLKDFTHLWNKYNLNYFAVEKYLKQLAQ